MIKVETMKRYESETGKQSAIVKFMVGGQALEPKSYPKLGPYDYSTDYIAWLEAKATAYDRMMSGGKKTLKEWANIFGMPFAIDGGRYGYNCDDVGSKEPLIWIPPRFIDYDGNYGESRTLPDGWEEE